MIVPKSEPLPSWYVDVAAVEYLENQDRDALLRAWNMEYKLVSYSVLEEHMRAIYVSKDALRDCARLRLYAGRAYATLCVKELYDTGYWGDAYVLWRYLCLTVTATECLEEHSTELFGRCDDWGLK